MISTPPAKLARLPCNARPMARPAAPIMAMKEVVSTPIIEATLISSRIRSTMLIRLQMKLLSARSTLRTSRTRPTLVVSLLISHQPISRVISARVSLPLYSSTTGSQASDSLTSSSTFISIGVLPFSRT